MTYNTYINFENDKTKLNDETFNMLQDLIKKDIENKILENNKILYPIGSTYVIQDNTNPSEILGFGTWERFSGLVAVGLDENTEEFNEIGKKVGEVKHQLTVAELPQHRFMLNLKRAGSGVNEKNQWGVNTQIANNMGDDFTEYVGNDVPHNIVQPTEVVGYMWIRRV